jgi:uncharacterized protein (TIGR03083 family)
MTRSGSHPVIPLLVDQWAAMDSLCTGFTEDEWKTSAPLPGWTVQDCIAHTIGVELMLMGEPAPDVPVDHLDHIHDPVNAVLETYIEVRRPLTGAEVLDEFRSITAQRTAALEAMTSEDLDRVGPSPIGDVPYWQFMQVRLFDCWMHEQDIRIALGRRGHEDGAIPETILTTRFPSAIGFVVGKRAGAPDGSSVVFDLVGGPVHGFNVVVDGRAKVVDEAPADPTVRITLPFLAFVALCGGRWDQADARARGGIEIEGDEVLATRVLDNLAFTP